MVDNDDSHKVHPGVREILVLIVVLAVGYFWFYPKFFR